MPSLKTKAWHTDRWMPHWAYACWALLRLGESRGVIFICQFSELPSDTTCAVLRLRSEPKETRAILFLYQKLFLATLPHSLWRGLISALMPAHLFRAGLTRVGVLLSTASMSANRLLASSGMTQTPFVALPIKHGVHGASRKVLGVFQLPGGEISTKPYGKPRSQHNQGH